MAWHFYSTASNSGTAPMLHATASDPLISRPFTVSCWFNVPGVPLGIGFPLISLQAGTATNDAARLQISGTLSLQALEQTATNNRNANTSPQVLITNSWNHGMGWFIATTDRRVMLNGCTPVTNATSCPATAPTMVGINNDPVSGAATPNIAGADIAEVAIWNVQLTEWEGRWLSKGNSPLTLRHRRGNLRFYRSFSTPDPNQELGKYDNKRLRTFNSPQPGKQNTFQKIKLVTPNHWLVHWKWFLLNIVSGTTTNLTLAAAASVLAAFQRKMGLNNITTSVGIAGTTMQVGKGLSIDALGGAASTMQIGKILAASAMGTATMTVMKVVLVTLIAVATAVAAISLQVGKGLSAGANGTASMTRQVGTNLAASAIASGAFVRQVGKFLTATTVAVSGTTMQVGKSLAASAVGGAVLTLTKIISVLLAAAASVTPTLSTLFSPAPTPTSATPPFVGHAGVGFSKDSRWQKRRAIWKSKAASWRQKWGND